MSEWQETEFGSIPTDWELLPFGKLLEIPLRNGLNKPSRVRGSGYKMVNMNEIFAFDRMENVPMELVPLSDKEKETSLLKKFDLLFARQSLVFDGAGKCSIFLSDEEDVCFEGHLIRARIDKKKANPLFYYYFFYSKRGKLFIRTIVEQAVVAGIRGSDLKDLLVPCPPKPEQDVIAKLADTLDAKIDLLRRQNHTLEQIAQTLFKRWFVEFEYPVNSEKLKVNSEQLFTIHSSLFTGYTGYKSSGGPMQPSELGEIPLGWRVGTLGEIFDTTSGGTPSRKRPDYYEDGSILWVKSKELYDLVILDTEEKITKAGLKNSSAKILPKNTMLIAMYGATVGQMSILATQATCNQAICAVLEKEYPYSFAYLWLKYRQKEWTGLAIGSAQQNLSQIVISNYGIIIPGNGVIKSFSQLVNPLFEKLINNAAHIRTLTRLRDILLPKLMSGKLRVSE